MGSRASRENQCMGCPMLGHRFRSPVGALPLLRYPRLRPDNRAVRSIPGISGVLGPKGKVVRRRRSPVKGSSNKPITRLLASIINTAMGELRSSPDECLVGDRLCATAVPTWEWSTVSTLHRLVASDGSSMFFEVKPYYGGERRAVWIRVE